ncbi:hypothetical protein BGX28_001111 [Mortierella sp. GBA30]|nr:hypothetical protein BGX28_001111 [Mortierella sp. GBA30]
MTLEATLMQLAVKNLAEWTQTQVKSRKEFNVRAYGKRQEQGTGPANAADAALHLNALPHESPVIGILAFDTPYFGLNSTIFTQAAYERVTGIAQKASGAYSLVSAYLPAGAAWSALMPSAGAATSNNTSARSGDAKKERTSSASEGFSPSSLWSATSAKVEKEKIVTTSSKSTTTSSSSSSSSKWGWGSIALGVGAAVVATGAAIAVQKHVNTGMEYVTSHIQFVGILWNSAQLKQRVTYVLRLPIGFHCFYTQVQIPAGSSNNWKPSSRTFIELMSVPQDARSYFSARQCSGQDEIEAHMEMFNPAKNFDYYPMGEETVKRVKNMVEDALNRKGSNL